MRELVPNDHHPVNQILNQQAHKVERYQFRSGEKIIDLEVAQAPTNALDDAHSGVLVMRLKSGAEAKVENEGESALKIEGVRIENEQLVESGGAALRQD